MRITENGPTETGLAIDKIDANLCSGCGICEMACPMDVIRMDTTTGTATIRYPEDCTGCGSCQADCPEQAVRVLPGGTVLPLTAW